jgi:hypothetical protein
MIASPQTSPHIDMFGRVRNPWRRHRIETPWMSDTTMSVVTTGVATAVNMSAHN